MKSYELSRAWFDFCFENPDLISPNHSAIFFFAIEHCNRLMWKKKFAFPSQFAMGAVGIKSYKTYIKAFQDLVEWGFFELHEEARNQYTANIIALVKNTKACSMANTKAHADARPKAKPKRCESKYSIDKHTKQLKQLKQENDENNENATSHHDIDIIDFEIGAGAQANLTGAENAALSNLDLIVPSPIARCLELYTTSERTFGMAWDQLCMSRYICRELLFDWAGVFAASLTSQGVAEKPLKDFAKHFFFWLQKQDVEKNPKKAFEHEQRNDPKPGTGPGDAKAVYERSSRIFDQ